MVVACGVLHIFLGGNCCAGRIGVEKSHRLHILIFFGLSVFLNVYCTGAVLQPDISSLRIDMGRYNYNLHSARSGIPIPNQPYHIQPKNYKSNEHLSFLSHFPFPVSDNYAFPFPTPAPLPFAFAFLLVILPVTLPVRLTSLPPRLRLPPTVPALPKVALLTSSKSE